MTTHEETEMHALAVQLETLTRGTGWEASRYMAIGMVLKRLTEYCAVCDHSNEIAGFKQEIRKLRLGDSYLA